MDNIERFAKEFAFDFNNNCHSIDRALDLIESKLTTIKNDRDKLAFLRFLRERILKDKAKHENGQECPDWCESCKERKNGLFILNQEIEEIERYFEPEVDIEDILTSEEESKLFTKINEIMSRFDNLDLANEVIFNEIDDLKQHFNLGRKSWQDLAAGRMLRLANVGVLETDQAKEILKSFGEALIAPFNNFLQ